MFLTELDRTANTTAIATTPPPGPSVVNHTIAVVEGSVHPGSIVLSHHNGAP
jgi:hypothetical protein